MDDHTLTFLTHLMTFLATLAGIVGGTVRSRNKAELAFRGTQIEFYREELDRTRNREQAALGREQDLRGEASNQRQELRVMHQEYDAARQSRMAKGKTVGTKSAALVVIDGEGTILDVSENISAYVGWTPADLIGKGLDKIIPEKDRPAHHTAILAASSVGKRVIRGEDDPASKLSLLCMDGLEVPVTIALIGGGKGKDARYTGSIRRRLSDSNY